MKFLKKLVNRGAPKGVPFLVLLAVIGVLATARARPAEAAGNKLQAYCWGTKDDFKDYLKNGSDENGIKISKYDAEFNFSNPKLKVVVGNKVKEIKLNERCTSKGDSPYRYWFWIKGNKMRTNPIHWSTEYFVATRRALKPKSNTDHGSSYGPAYNTAQYSDDHVNVDRLEARSGGFFQSVGEKIEHGGKSWQLSFYVIDLQEWFDKSNEEPDKYIGYVYLHTVAATYNGNRKVSQNLTTLQQWLDATENWDNTGRLTYKDHYNQRLYLNKVDKHWLEVYMMHTSKEHAIKGSVDEKSGKPVEACRFERLMKGNPEKFQLKSGSIFNLKSIKTYKDSDGKVYYLKGIKETYVDKKGNWHPYGKFYILDSLNKDPITGTKDADAKKTDEYTKVGNKYANGERDTVSNRSFDFVQTYTLAKDSDTQKIKLSKSKTVSSDGSMAYCTVGSMGLTGKQTWEDLATYMADLTWKNSVLNNRIYLIYQEAPKAEVTLVKKTYEYDDEVGQYECNNNETKKTWELKKGTKSYSIAKLNKDHKNAAPIALKNNNINYYARYVKFSYTDKDGKEHEKTLDLTDFKVDGKEYGVFSGKNASKENITKAVEKMYEKVTMNNLSPSTKIEITIKYYQPKTPTALVGYYQFYDENGEMQRVKLFKSIRIYSLIRIVFLLTSRGKAIPLAN